RPFFSRSSLISCGVTFIQIPPIALWLRPVMRILYYIQYIRLGLTNCAYNKRPCASLRTSLLYWAYTLYQSLPPCELILRQSPSSCPAYATANPFLYPFRRFRQAHPISWLADQHLSRSVFPYTPNASGSFNVRRR